MSSLEGYDSNPGASPWPAELLGRDDIPEITPIEAIELDAFYILYRGMRPSDPGIYHRKISSEIPVTVDNGSGSTRILHEYCSDGSSRLRIFFDPDSKPMVRNRSHEFVIEENNRPNKAIERPFVGKRNGVKKYRRLKKKALALDGASLALAGRITREATKVTDGQA